MTTAALATPERGRTDAARRVAAFGAIYLLWGGTFLALRYAVAEIPPMLTIAIRCAGGALILFVWSAARGALVRPTLAQWRVATAAGLLLFVGCHTLLAWAEQRVSSGQAALLLTSIPLWLVILEALLRRRRPAGRVLAGLATGVAGVSLLAGDASSWAGTLVDRIAIVFGGLCWAGGSLVARDGARPASALQSTAMQLAAGAVAVSLGSWALGEVVGWPGIVSPRALGALVFLVIGGTAIAFAAYTWLLRITTAAAVGTYAFVNPLVAVALAWATGDEPARARTLIAATLVVGATLLVRQPTAGERQ